jgi:hypothetical protein
MRTNAIECVDISTGKTADAVVMRGRGDKGLAHMSLLVGGQVRAFEYELNLIQGKKGKLL